MQAPCSRKQPHAAPMQAPCSAPLTVLGPDAGRHDLALGVARLDVAVEAAHELDAGVDAAGKAAVLAGALFSWSSGVGTGGEATRGGSWVARLNSAIDTAAASTLLAAPVSPLLRALPLCNSLPDRLTCGSLMTPGFLLYQSRVRPTLGWITLTPACAAATPCTRL
jgi:hypothetical protein